MRQTSTLALYSSQKRSSSPSAHKYFQSGICEFVGGEVASKIQQVLCKIAWSISFAERRPKKWRRILVRFLPATLTSALPERIQEPLGLMRLGVRIPDPAEVFDYLLRFPEMSPVVVEAARLAAEMLPDAQLTLQVYHDPEIHDEYLVLYARFASYDETTMARIEEISDKYIIPLLKNTSGWLILTTDFRPPE